MKFHLTIIYFNLNFFILHFYSFLNQFRSFEISSVDLEIRRRYLDDWNEYLVEKLVSPNGEGDKSSDKFGLDLK